MSPFNGSLLLSFDEITDERLEAKVATATECYEVRWGRSYAERTAAVTFVLLVALGAGRASVAGLGLVRTIAETVAIGLVAALAGVGISLLVSYVIPHAWRAFGALADRRDPFVAWAEDV